MRPAIFFKTLRDLRWQVFWYGLGLALLAAMIVFIYPSYSEQLKDLELPPALEAFTGAADITTGPGFVSAEFFSWVPILVVIFAIMAGTSALAGEEVDGTLELLLARPVSRARLVVEKAAALLVAGAGICAFACAGWLLSVPFVEIDVSLGRLALATFVMLPLIFFFAALAMWAGAAFPGRLQATGFVTAVAVLSFVINYLANLVESIRDLQVLSVFYYFDGDSILLHGFDVLKVAVLAGLGLFFAVMALLTFENREIGVRGGGLIPPRLRPPTPA